MSRILQRILIVIGLIILGILVVTMFCSPTTKVPGVSSAATIKMVHLGIRLLSENDTNAIERLIASSDNSLPHHMNEALAKILLANGIWPSNSWGITKRHPHRFVDAWGRPLELMSRDRVATDSILALETNRIVVWSIGQNGTNEFGAGDDISISAGPHIRSRKFPRDEKR